MDSEGTRRSIPANRRCGLECFVMSYAAAKPQHRGTVCLNWARTGLWGCRRVTGGTTRHQEQEPEHLVGNWTCGFSRKEENDLLSAGAFPHSLGISYSALTSAV